MKRLSLLTLAAVLLVGVPLHGQSLLNWNLKSTWDSFYEIGAEGAWGHPNTRAEVTLNYQRFVIKPLEKNNAAAISTLLGWTRTSKIHIVNCGFGWILEALAELGIETQTCSTTSTYIQSAKLLSEDTDIRAKVENVGLTTTTGDGLSVFGFLREGRLSRTDRAADIIDADASTVLGRTAIRQSIGSGNYDVVTWEGYLNSFTDADAVTFSGNLHRLSGVSRVIHVVYPWLNNKTLAQWKALLPNDFFVDGLTYQVQ